MTNHAKIYLSCFSIGIDEIWRCEMCDKQDRIVNLQIHHIYGKHTEDRLKQMCIFIRMTGKSKRS